MNARRFSVLALDMCLVAVLAITASSCVVVDAKSASGGDAVVCHKGKKTLTLPQEAVGAHLDHGDRRGAC